MRNLEQTWRWYGPEDSVSLQDANQAGATGIVTALHGIPHGEIWPIDLILERKSIIEAAGLVWSVVESVPVHESIKTGAADSSQYLDNYKQTIINLAKCGIKIICYNFMPVLDWTRTQLDYLMPDASKALYFNWVDLAIFDIYILKRPNAIADFPNDIQKLATEKYKTLNSSELERLRQVVLMGIPSERDITLDELQNSIEVYSKIGFNGLRENLKKFLTAIADVCTAHQVSMTIHPDDPPYPILGLPRIASNKDDFEYILNCVDQPFNGVCYCTGSLGAGKENNLLAILKLVKARVYFAHLRNVKKDEHGSFYEADHLDGDVDMFEIMQELLIENRNRNIAIPFRPDHGHQMLDDLGKTSNPGYSAIGRLRGLAELRGLELGILRSQEL